MKVRMTHLTRTLLLSVLLFTTSTEAAPAPAAVGNFTEEAIKPAELALRNSGQGLAISGGFVALIGLSCGVDVSGLLRHGQFLAFAAQLKGLDLNFTACREGPKKSSASKSTCPRSQNEKVFTRWSSFFNFYGLNFAILQFETDANGNYDVFADDIRASRAVGTLVFLLLLILAISGLQFLALRMTETEEEDYDRHLEEAYEKQTNKAMDIGDVQPTRCGFITNKYPQIILPFLPVRYWFNYPYVQLKVWMTFHFSLCCAGMSAIGTYSDDGGIPALGYIILIFLCAPLPFITYGITHKLLEELENPDDETSTKVRFVKAPLETYKLVGGITYRDVDWENARRGKAHYVKPWRKSTLVNRFAAPFFNLKVKRKHWITGQLCCNFIEAGLLTGAFVKGRASIVGISEAGSDILAILSTVYYLFQFFAVLVVRPYHQGGNQVMGLLQNFHNGLIVMASVLYIQGGIFNTQDVVAIASDGVEEMLCIAGSFGCVIWMLNILLNSMFVCTRAKTVYDGDVRWDIETDDHRRNTMGKQGSGNNDSFKALTDRGKSNSSLPPMLRVIMDKKKQQEVSMLENPMSNKVETAATNAEPDAAAVTPPAAAAAATPAAATRPAGHKSSASVSNPSLPPGWQPVSDPVSGRTYYYNAVTKATSWEVPSAAGPALPSGWQAVQDPTSGRTYYYNAATKATSWTIPLQ